MNTFLPNSAKKSKFVADSTFEDTIMNEFLAIFKEYCMQKKLHPFCDLEEAFSI